jgi:hypothetical protein
MPKLGVEQIKSNGEFDLYLGHLIQRNFSKIPNLHVTHVYPCVKYERINTQLKGHKHGKYTIKSP